MKYLDAPDLKARMTDIVHTLGMDHVDLSRVECLRSKGSSTRRTLARCHALNKVMQKAMKTKAFYAIEFLELFEKLSLEEQNKVILHEIMHIPKAFGGGFRQHDFVTDRNVDGLYRQYVRTKKIAEKNVKSFENELIEKDKEKKEEFEEWKKGLGKWF